MLELKMYSTIYIRTLGAEGTKVGVKKGILGNHPLAIWSNDFLCSCHFIMNIMFNYFHKFKLFHYVH